MAPSSSSSAWAPSLAEDTVGVGRRRKEGTKEEQGGRRERKREGGGEEERGEKKGGEEEKGEEES